MIERSVGIMQPYVFPYIGYFHLIQASSMFVFYDDVTYIKGGWINRNRIINKEKKDLVFTIPISKASSYKLIKEISPALNAKWKNKFYKQLIQNYSKAPFFDSAIEPIMSVFARQYTDVTDLAIESISVIYSFLGIKFKFTKSSIISPESRGMEKTDRLITIIKQLGYKNYVNPAGGREIYSKKYFSNHGVSLFFIKSIPIEYRQYSEKFVPWLSIIDIIMFNDKESTIELLGAYCLE